MQYKVTCSNCSGQFIIEAQAGQTVQCRCPFCQNEMVVALPEAVEPPTAPQQPRMPQRPLPSGQPKRNGCSWQWGVIAVILIAVVAALGGYLWLSSVQAEQDRQWEQRRQQQQLKAHSDSLMRIREAEEARQRNDNMQEVRERNISRFIEAFYLKAVLTPQGGRGYEHYLTTHCLEKLTTIDEGDSIQPRRTDVAWRLFRTDSQQPDYETMRGRLQVVSEGDDWYRVSLVERGQTTYRHLKVSIEGSNILIDDVR